MNVINFSKLKNLDIFLLVNVTMLIVLGLLTVYSSTFYLGKETSQFFYNHVLFVIIGMCLFFSISVLNLKYLNNKFFISGIAIINILLLVLVLFAGTESFGAQRWLEIGPFTLQPSEFSKLAIIFLTAFILSRKDEVFEEVKNVQEKNRSSSSTHDRNILIGYFLLFFNFAITVFLVLKQRSLGNTILISLIFIFLLASKFELTFKRILFGITTFLMVFVFFRNDIREIVAAIIAVLCIFYLLKIKIWSALPIIAVSFVIPLGINFAFNNVLEPYQQTRIISLINPSEDSNINEDYNRQRSLDAVGSGQLFGKGFLQGDIVNNGLLPFAYTDFAFAAYSEQFGFIGASILILLMYLFINKIFSVSSNSKDMFQKKVILGIGLLILFNTIQHIGMNVGLLPITGVPLPFLSYGGSSTLLFMIALGFVNSVYLDNLDDTSEVVKLRSEYSL